MFDKQNLAFTAIASRSLYSRQYLWHSHSFHSFAFFPTEKYFLLDSLIHSLIIFKERVKNFFQRFFSFYINLKLFSFHFFLFVCYLRLGCVIEIFILKQ